MTRRVLITGGAGFIGSHLADLLLDQGDEVRVLDDLSEQVHGPGRAWPTYLDERADRVRGDAGDRRALRRALADVDAVVHLAARVGVGQSMYRVADYAATNTTGTAVLLEALIEHPVERLVVASSMSIYGEGLYEDEDGREVDPGQRDPEALRAGRWDLCAPDGSALCPRPTPESKHPTLASVYALTKHDQERLCLLVGEAYDIPTVALRLFNVYGPRQGLSNPYTGVLAIIAARLLNGSAPVLFEDGRQMRDFVSVHDVARAFALALDAPAEADGRAMNVGSGRAVTIRELAVRLARVMRRSDLEPVVLGRFRAGDVRHCFADVTLARELLGFEAQVGIDEGMAELADWLEGQDAQDPVEVAHAELRSRGLAG